MESEYICFKLFVNLVFAYFSSKQAVVHDFLHSNFEYLTLYRGMLSNNFEKIVFSPDVQEWRQESLFYSLWSDVEDAAWRRDTLDVRSYTEPLDIGWKKADLLKKLEDWKLSADAFHYFNGERADYLDYTRNQAAATQEIVSPDPVTKQNDTVKMHFDKRLSAILDPNDSNHAPELALAVKLWLELYGRDEKTKHSHSHGADLFLQKQPFQSTAKERVKEITSPIKNWNKQRRKAFDEAQK